VGAIFTPAVKMEAAGSSEMLLITHMTSQCHITENYNLNFYHFQNLKCKTNGFSLHLS
jgi:hypothetical protein